MKYWNLPLDARNPHLGQRATPCQYVHHAGYSVDLWLVYVHPVFDLCACACLEDLATFADTQCVQVYQSLIQVLTED